MVEWRHYSVLIKTEIIWCGVKVRCNLQQGGQSTNMTKHDIKCYLILAGSLSHTFSPAAVKAPTVPRYLPPLFLILFGTPGGRSCTRIRLTTRVFFIQRLCFHAASLQMLTVQAVAGSLNQRPKSLSLLLGVFGLDLHVGKVLRWLFLLIS